MIIKYEEINPSFGEPFIKATTDDGFIMSIPIHEANSDYQRYLRWLNGENDPQFI